MTMSEILAKSQRVGQDPKTLLQHTLDVMDAAEGMFGNESQPTTRLARAWFRFFKLPNSVFSKFRHTLIASAAFHDCGKSNHDFQECVQGKKQRQRIRHEHLSLK
jgi:CRISPR-associated endonuclease/helicase Cas3